MIDTQTAQSLCALVREAGVRTLQLREQDRLNLQQKDDGTPVTRADHESQDILLDGLLALTPDVPVISEERPDSLIQYAGCSTYWLVDPLDGTRDFIRGRNDYSINVGLIVDHVPCFGIVFAPARDDLFYGGLATGLFRNGEALSTQPPAPPTTPDLLISLRDARSNPVDVWQAAGHVGKVMVHASAYKLALLAAGGGDLLLRTSVTYEWDTAAGDALVRVRGGRLMTPDGTTLAYGKERRTNGPYIAFTGEPDSAYAFIKQSGLGWPLR